MMDSGWRNVKTRRTIRWRGKRMTVTINRACYFLYVKPQPFAYFSTFSNIDNWG